MKYEYVITCKKIYVAFILLIFGFRFVPDNLKHYEIGPQYLSRVRGYRLLWILGHERIVQINNLESDALFWIITSIEPSSKISVCSNIAKGLGSNMYMTGLFSNNVAESKWIDGEREVACFSQNRMEQKDLLHFVTIRTTPNFTLPIIGGNLC